MPEYDEEAAKTALQKYEIFEQGDGKLFRLYSDENLSTSEKLWSNYQKHLPLWHQDHDKGFSYDRSLKLLDIYWGGYSYEIPLEYVRTPHHLTSQLLHILEKDWRGPSQKQLRSFISCVLRATGFDEHIWHRSECEESITVKDERAKLTHKLRYKILRRDDFRCCACGATANTAQLQVDHVQPVSKGGVTEMWNLQTLCSACNQGKGAEPLFAE